MTDRSVVNSNILFRVFRIYVGNSSGTCFTIEHNNSQFIITVKHLFKDIDYPDHIQIGLLQNHKIVYIDCDVNYCEGDIDIAVLKPNPTIVISRKTNIIFSLDGTQFGEEVYFVGYPFDYDLTLRNLPSSYNPIPFFKHAYISCFVNNELIALDGINNPGFSGSPVCRFENGKTIVFGIVSGYRFVRSTVYKEENGNETSTGDYVKENTGIVYAYSITKALELLKEKWS